MNDGIIFLNLNILLNKYKNLFVKVTIIYKYFLKWLNNISSVSLILTTLNSSYNRKLNLF